MKTTFALLTLLSCLLNVSNAHAVTGYPGFNAAIGQSVGQPESMNFVAIGTTHEEGIFLGFRYENYALKNSGEERKQFAAGGTFGFSDRGSYILGNYFFGKGHGFDVGYQFPVYKEYLTLGLQYSLRHLTYENADQMKITKHFPLIVIGGNF
jgi:hypothetical protein